MKYIPFMLSALLCVVMASATFIEDRTGTDTAHTLIYDSWWFNLLWVVTLTSYLIYIVITLSERRSKTDNDKKGTDYAAKTIVAFLLLFGSAQSVTLANAPKCIKLSQADSLKYQQVIYNGRVCPLNTVARDFTQKITGKHKFKGLTAEQILISWSLHPEDWKDVKMIKVKKKQALKELNIETEKASFADFFDKDMMYRLPQGKYTDIEEKLSIIIMATRGELFTPVTSSHQMKSENKVKCEVFYNNISWNMILFICCFCITLLVFYTEKTHKSPLVCDALILITLSALVLSLILRWYISEHLPLTNTYETMQIIALSTLSLALFSRNLRTYSLIISAAILLVTHISSLDPVITPLMPALQSPWLASHVTTIMISYALFSILLFKADMKILVYAEILLATGITLGSIWAKTAWGTYWSWDPKETWALISFIVYLYPLHGNTLRWFRDDRHKLLYLRLAFLTILMTYFGCNYLLTGMHSYAQ